MTVEVNADFPRSVLLIGAGQMAIDYVNVLKSVNITPLVFGRGEVSAQKFQEVTGIRAGTGPLESQIAQIGSGIPDTAIVAANAYQLADISSKLFRAGVKRILIEKPAALDLAEMGSLLQAMRETDGRAWVAYNRRFLSSVEAADRIIANDGGALSVFFNFSEPARRIATLGKPERELTTWFYGNSTHVLDLAFYFSGEPASLGAAIAGGSVIDSETGIFVGHGISETGCHIAWHANWVGPGRWGVEVVTREHRLIFQPLEKLRVQTHAGFGEIPVETDDVNDRNFKPGLLLQTKAFLAGATDQRLLSLQDHARLMQAYEAIRTGNSWSIQGQGSH